MYEFVQDRIPDDCNNKAPQVVVQSQSRTFFSFSRIIQTYHFFNIRVITHIFFSLSRSQVNKKGLFTPLRTPKRPFTHHAHMSASRNHAIIFSFSCNHATKTAIHAITQTYGGGGLSYRLKLLGWKASFDPMNTQARTSFHS